MSEIGEMKYNDLKALASSRGLDSKGTKEELIARLEKAEGKDAGGSNIPASNPSVTEGGDSEKPVNLPPAVERAEQTKADREYKNDQQKMKANLDGQPKVSIMIPFDSGEKPEQAKDIPFTIVLNGYRYENPVGFGGIQRGVRVEVPQQIAEIVWARLESEGRIGANWRTDRSSATQEALT
jgi:hypothetical protein